MFQIDKNTSAITMHKGDTGAYYVTLHKKGGGSFEAGDVAIYKVKQGSTVKIEREYPLDDDEGAGNGRFLVAFRNSDTDTWAAGTYNTEIRVSLNAIRDLMLYMLVSPAERSQGDPITATVDEATCIGYVTATTGTLTFTYDDGWSDTLSNYGITVTGTPVDGDEITISWNKEGTGQIVDGDTVRTITRSKSTITILDVLTDI